MIGVCKFCKCTEMRPCFFIGTEGELACAWLLEDVCTNPDCVVKAYLEARPQAEELQQKIDMILEAA